MKLKEVVQKKLDDKKKEEDKLRTLMDSFEDYPKDIEYRIEDNKIKAYRFRERKTWFKGVIKEKFCDFIVGIQGNKYYYKQYYRGYGVLGQENLTKQKLLDQIADRLIELGLTE